jgi:hypothetical protein
MKRSLRILSLLLIVAMAACAKPPKAEMDAAEAAYARVSKLPDVAAYAPDALQRLQTAIDNMRAESKARHYDKAKAFAADATTAADAATAAATANKERSKAKAQELIDATKKALPEAEKLLASAARVKSAAIDRNAQAAEIAGAKTALADAQAAFAAGDYLKAVDKAGGAQKTLADLQAAISAAVQSATRKK